MYTLLYLFISKSGQCNIYIVLLEYIFISSTSIQEETLNKKICLSYNIEKKNLQSNFEITFYYFKTKCLNYSHKISVKKKKK